MDPAAIADATLVAQEADFSLFSLFLRADFVVKMVMLSLFLASVWSWSIILAKWLMFGRVRSKLAGFEQMFWSGKSLEELYESIGPRPDHVAAILFVAAMREWRRGQSKTQQMAVGGLQMRIEKVMQVTIARQMEKLERHLLFLANVGATAPFIGLLGTVWGIMNSFQSIAVSNSTSLAVVAPGIAEALFATALGLAAAIPAVIGYNRLSSNLSGIGMRLEGFADEFSAILSRELDNRE